jgi:hypothetical protein
MKNYYIDSITELKRIIEWDIKELNTRELTQ